MKLCETCQFSDILKPGRTLITFPDGRKAILPPDNEMRVCRNLAATKLFESEEPGYSGYCSEYVLDIRKQATQLDIDPDDMQAAIEIFDRLKKREVRT